MDSIGRNAQTFRRPICDLRGFADVMALTSTDAG
jgi:hypothetical protein